MVTDKALLEIRKDCIPVLEMHPHLGRCASTGFWKTGLMPHSRFLAWEFWMFSNHLRLRQNVRANSSRGVILALIRRKDLTSFLEFPVGIGQMHAQSRSGVHNGAADCRFLRA
eukprot:gb/GECG01002623.1/.p1 GENE.gb/GECG01002623.1/~~gb/GECG01002623.1/.p1  ORF type:complete len:113 (+),score=5.96 gb/GECG01002623.1/:1-339(+)